TWVASTPDRPSSTPPPPYQPAALRPHPHPVPPVHALQQGTSLSSSTGRRRDVARSNFESAYPTKIIIHGYTATLPEGGVLFVMKDELLKRSDFNVIIVNWTDSNGRPYAQAVANGRVVGAQTAKLIELLMENKGLRAEDVHIIGHSLGAQVSGWAGERIKGIGRITGLDPAGPFFQHAPNKVRLDKTDARFIDILHTNGGGTYIEGLGIREAIGDLDFYPNGGNRQPGAPIKPITTQIIESLSITDESPKHGAYVMRQ
ncbi:pancreatic triacylglycerol lipase, partial [Caerostris extrusa]